MSMYLTRDCMELKKISTHCFQWNERLFMFEEAACVNMYVFVTSLVYSYL